VLVQVIVLVEDLSAARKHFEQLGFLVADGGRHPGRGTANLVIPFGSAYLELLAVVDMAEARSSPQGRPVVDALAARGPGLARWSLETSTTAMADVSARVGLPVEHRERMRPDGARITWQSVGVDEAWAEPWRCAFMAWDDSRLHPARFDQRHPNGATGFERLEVAVPDEAELHRWVGGPLPANVALTAGNQPGPRSLSIGAPAGTITLNRSAAAGG